MDLSGFINGNYGEEYISLDRNHIECEEMFAQADLLIKEERIQAAIEVLFKIVQRNPQYGKAHNHLGWIYENKYKNSASAEECYKKAMKYAPEYAAAYLNYCYLLSNNQRFDELKEHLDITSNVPSIPKETVYLEYAIMYEMQQNPEAAIDYYVKAAMTTLSSDKLTSYKESINRCKTKIELKNSLSHIHSLDNQAKKDTW